MVCYGCHPDYCICPQPEAELSLVGQGSPRSYAQSPTHGQQRPRFDIDPSSKPGRGFFDNVPVNHAPPSSNRHHLHTLGHNPGPFATDFHRSIEPNPASAAYDQHGRNPYLSYDFSSSDMAFNTYSTTHADTATDGGGSYRQDDQRSRRPFQSSPTQRARTSSLDSFVYDVGFKSVQDARRRAARREREHGSRHPSHVPLENRFETFSVNSLSRADPHHPSLQRTAPTTKWRRQVCYDCTPGDCICPTVSDDSE